MVLCSGVITLGGWVGSSVVMVWSGAGGITVGRVGSCVIVVGATTLRAHVGFAGVCVVGSVASDVGTFSIPLSCVAISSNAFCTVSPSRKLGTVFAGGFVSIVTMSLAACFK